MRLEELDINFKLNAAVEQLEDVEWRDVRDGCVSLFGLCAPVPQDDEPFHRIPCSVAEATSPGVAGLNFHTAGVRACFETDSPYLALVCELYGPMSLMSHMPLSGSQGFDLYREEADGRTLFFKRSFFPPNVTGIDGFSGVVYLPTDKAYTYTLGFPLYGTVKRLRLGIKRGSILRPAQPYRDGAPVVFYGSSITQGGCASRPGNSYEGHLSRRFGFDYKNLGFSGNAKGEGAIVDFMASLDMSVFVCDYDHNAPDLAHLQATLEPLYRAIRAAHPDIPFIFASSPGVRTGEERRLHVRKVYECALAEGDANVYYVDGGHMFDGDGADTCTMEGCHPNDLGFFRMYQSFSKIFEQIFEG